MRQYFDRFSYPGPEVNYPQGDYRTISKLDRQRAEMAKNARLEAELARERQWKDLEFQKKLMELQKNLFGGGGVSSTSGASLQTPAGYGGGGGGGGGMGDSGFTTSFERMDPDFLKWLSLQAGSARQRVGVPGANVWYSPFGALASSLMLGRGRGR